MKKKIRVSRKKQWLWKKKNKDVDRPTVYRRLAHRLILHTFCWRHSLHARFTAVLRRDDDDGRVSPSPFSSSSLDAERLKPRAWLLLGLAKGCGRACSPGVVGDKECSMLFDMATDIADNLGCRGECKWGSRWLSVRGRQRKSHLHSRRRSLTPTLQDQEGRGTDARLCASLQSQIASSTSSSAGKLYVHERSSTTNHIIGPMLESRLTSLLLAGHRGYPTCFSRHG